MKSIESPLWIKVIESGGSTSQNLVPNPHENLQPPIMTQGMRTHEFYNWNLSFLVRFSGFWGDVFPICFFFVFLFFFCLGTTTTIISRLKGIPLNVLQRRLERQWIRAMQRSHGGREVKERGSRGGKWDGRSESGKVHFRPGLTFYTSSLKIHPTDQMTKGFAESFYMRKCTSNLYSAFLCGEEQSKQCFWMKSHCILICISNILFLLVVNL